LYYVIWGNDINIISYELVSYLKSWYNEYGSRNRIDVNDIRFENWIVYLTISIDNTNTINPPPKENIQIDLTKKNTISNLIKDLKNIQIDSTKKSIN
jgi:hypothetical protein